MLSLFYFLIGSFSLLIISSSSSTLAFGLMTWLVGGISIMSINHRYQLGSLKIFYISFCIYTIIAWIHYLDIINYHQWIFPDEMGYRNFFNWGATTQYDNIVKVLLNESEITTFGYQNYIFYISSIGYAAQKWFDGPNEMLMLQVSILAGSLISIILYRTFSIYLNKRKAFNYVLAFITLSPICQYSTIFLRDIYVTLIFCCAYLIVLKKYSTSGLIKLIVLDLIVWGIRPANGAFYLLFIFFYLYRRFHKYKFAGYLTVISTIVVVYISVSTSLDSVSFHMDSYEELESTGSDLSKRVEALPSPISDVIQILFVLFRPFPVIQNLISTVNIYVKFLNGILPFAATFLWFITSFSIFKWAILKKLKSVSFIFALLFIISVLYMALNYKNFDPRRVMAGLPIPFLLFAIAREKLVSYKEKTRTMIEAIIIHISIAIILLFH